MRYLIEKLLLEQPHVFLDMDEESEDSGGIWDFCAEDRPKTWIIQLIKLYAMHKLETLNPRKNNSTVLYLTPDEVDMFTQHMADDPFFIIQAKSCVDKMKRDNQDKAIQLLQKYLPDVLLSKIGISKEDVELEEV
jgi:hypothetical protein